VHAAGVAVAVEPAAPTVSGRLESPPSDLPHAARATAAMHATRVRVR
jgi:hypothetical protein